MAAANGLSHTATEPDIEVGLSEVLRHHITRHLKPQPISRRKLAFERKRPAVVRACVAETIGVFVYVYAAVLLISPPPVDKC